PGPGARVLGAGDLRRGLHAPGAVHPQCTVCTAPLVGDRGACAGPGTCAAEPPPPVGGREPARRAWRDPSWQLYTDRRASPTRQRRHAADLAAALPGAAPADRPARRPLPLVGAGRLDPLALPGCPVHPVSPLRGLSRPRAAPSSVLG